MTLKTSALTSSMENSKSASTTTSFFSNPPESSALTNRSFKNGSFSGSIQKPPEKACPPKSENKSLAWRINSTTFTPSKERQEPLITPGNSEYKNTGQ